MELEFFSYKVSTGDQSSNLADAAFTILPVNDIPDLLTNTGKSIPEGISYIIKNTELNSSDVEDSSSNITYTIETAPRNGELKLDGVTLNVNDNFRQSDINNSTLTYLHTALNTDDDSFQFSVQDSSAAEAIGATTSTPATFAIIITIDLCLHSSETFTNNSIFTMPANCYSITLKMWGGGGGGSPAYEDLGMGGQGGPGGYTGLSRATIPGTIYQIKIGAGGRGGQNNEINCGSTGGVGTDTFSGGNGGEPRSDGGDGEGLPDRPTLGGGGAEEAKELNTIQGGSGCGGTGASAIISGNAGAGSGGDCLGDDNLQGAGRIPAHSALADRSAEGGTAGKYDSCDSLNGGDGKVIISY